MPYGSLTVADLRKAIEGMPDDSPVLVKPNDPGEWASCDRKRVRNGTEVTIVEARPATPWDYRTRELHNAYQCNDDRYDQNQILMIELGEFGP